jgi:integrase
MKFTKTAIENLSPTGNRYEVRDDILAGLLVRVGSSGDKAFYFQYRTGKGRGAANKRFHIGTFPTLTVEQARQIAKEKAAVVAMGGDPAQEVREEKTAATMQNSLHGFIEEHVAKLKLQSIKSYTTIIMKRLLPGLGKLHVKDVSFSDVAKLHHSMKNTPYLANRSLAVLSKFFGWCEMRGYRERGSNPCHGVTKYKEHKRQEFMGATELSLLGDTISRMEKTWIDRQEGKTQRKKGDAVDTITPQAAAAIRLLMFTGARVSEVLSLEWKHIDLDQGTALLPDSKTGFKVLQLPAPALAVLECLPQISEWVFPGSSASGHMVNIKDAWGDVLNQAGMDGWRLHDLRHAFASMMVNSGASLPIVGKILGHSQASTTQRYAHLEENPARKAAEVAAAKIAEAMKTPPKHGKVLAFPKAEGSR